MVRGIHHSEVKPHRIQKSVAVEETYFENLVDDEAVAQQLLSISEDLENRLRQKDIKGKSLTLKIKYQDFSMFTRSRTQEMYYENAQEFYKTAQQLWELRPYNKPVRLLGLSLSNLNMAETKQISVQLKIPFAEFD